MKLKFSDLISPEGTIDRAEYVFWGVVLFRHQIQHRSLHCTFSIFIESGEFGNIYFRYSSIYHHKKLVEFYDCIADCCFPFIWSGCVLTTRRIRISGLPVWLVVLFFVPIVNLFLFAIMALLPEIQIQVRIVRNDSSRLANLIPQSRAGSALSGPCIKCIVSTCFHAI